MYVHNDAARGAVRGAPRGKFFIFAEIVTKKVLVALALRLGAGRLAAKLAGVVGPGHIYTPRRDGGMS